MTEQEEKTLKTALRWYMDMYGCRPERNVYDGTVEYSCNGYVTNKEDALSLIIKQEKEIAQLKAENVRLTTKLGQVLLSIDTVKEMNVMCNIAAQVKQAKIDVLNELKKKKSIAVWDIDEMIAEYENEG